MNTHRIEIMNPVRGMRIECKDTLTFLAEMKEVFLNSNVIRYYIVTNDHPLTTEDKNRIEVGTRHLNFVFDIKERSVDTEVAFMQGIIKGFQSKAHYWFDKRTKEYKYAYSFPNGFNTPLIFKEFTYFM